VRLEAWDAVFVRARRADVHPLLRDLRAYTRWWPGITATPAGEATRLRLSPPGPLQRLGVRSHEVVATVRKERRNLGIDLAYRGQLAGEAEFYYLDEPSGVVVHYLVRADTADRGWRRRLAGHRAVMRAGLNAVKARLEGDRLPGSEPDPLLLRDQQAAIAEFQAGVEAHARKMAALRASADRAP
jgi:hypothetical protein